MMDPSTEHSFEDQWKKTFEGASVPPPPSVWDAIEAHLDASEDKKVVPLWWQSGRLWAVAASIAALLVVGGIWMTQNDGQGKGEKADIAKVGREEAATPSVTPVDSADNEVVPAGSENVPAKPADRLASANTAERANPTTRGSQGSAAGKRRIAPIDGSESTIAFKRTDVPAIPSVTDVEKTENAGDNRVAAVTPVEVTKKQEVVPAMASVVESDRMAVVQTPDLLEGLGTKDLGVYVQKRYVFLKQEQSDIVASEPKRQKEYWAGVGVMPATFNPDVNLKTSPSSFSYASFARQKSVTGKSEAGASYALQTQGGVRLSKHWSLETGISYLQANSSYQGGGYLQTATASAASNVLENALADAYSNTNKGGGKEQALSADQSNLYIDINRQVRNDYQYIQVPVQTGFTLNPDGKLSYSLLGGMMANFFLNNQLESANGGVIKTTASDEVYRSLNWSATTGLRLNYKFSNRWRAMLTGSYQKALMSGVRANQSLDSHPYLYGVSWGMRYSF